jgi:hypothetical protein
VVFMSYPLVVLGPSAALKITIFDRTKIVFVAYYKPNLELQKSSKHR